MIHHSTYNFVQMYWSKEDAIFQQYLTGVLLWGAYFFSCRKSSRWKFWKIEIHCLRATKFTSYVDLLILKDYNKKLIMHYIYWIFKYMFLMWLSWADFHCCPSIIRSSGFGMRSLWRCMNRNSMMLDMRSINLDVPIIVEMVT